MDCFFVLTVYICLGDKSRYYLAVFRKALLFETIFSLDGGNEKQAVCGVNYIRIREGYFEKTKIAFLDYSHRHSFAGSRVEHNG
jgi:hypothetical protein